MKHKIYNNEKSVEKNNYIYEQCWENRVIIFEKDTLHVSHCIPK